MGTTAFFSLITVIIFIIAAVAIAKVLKEIFEFLFKLIAGMIGIGTIILFIFFASRHSIPSEEFNAEIPEQQFSKKVNPRDLFPDNSSEGEFFSTDKLQRVAYTTRQQNSNESTKIIVEHHHYYHNSDSPTIFTKEEYENIPKKKEIVTHTSKSRFTKNATTTNIPRAVPKQSVNEHSINCYGKVIPSEHYVVVEGVYSNVENAQRQVAFLKNNGFSRADFFWAPCYNTVITRNLFVVILDRHCRTKESAERKKEKGLRKMKEENIKNISLRIIQINSKLSQNQELQDTSIL